MTNTKQFTEYTRNSWNPREAKAMTPQGAPKEGFIHHSDDPSGSGFDTLAKQKEKVHGIQAFHMGPERGWSDIGYHYVIFQPNRRHTRAHIFRGRDFHMVPAAQLNHNSNTLAICVVGNGDVEALHDNTRAAIRFLVHRHNTVVKLGGHRDVVSTTCPGGRFYRAIPSIAAALGIRHF